MKVLYIGSERSEAQTIASALRGVDEAVSVLWAAQLESATNWLGESRGLDVLVMEAPIDGASCLVVLRQLRRLALPPVVVFVVPDGIAPTLDSLHPGAHYVRRNQFLSRDLPIVVTRAIERDARAELERKLAQADKQLAEQQAKYDIGMARAEANWEMVDEQLRTAAQRVEQSRQSEELAAADIERLSRRDSELYAQLSDAAAAQDALERQLADAHSAVAAANERLAQAIDEKRVIEMQLAQALSAREDAQRGHAAAMNDVGEHTARETELNDLLAEITARRTDLEHKLVATQAAFEDAVTRATRERLAASKKAAEREAELDRQIRRESATRATLEQTLADATTELDDARREHEAAVADVSRLTERETDLTSQLAVVQTARETLERELADAASALRSAATRESDLAEQIQHERDTRISLEQKIADADAASRATQKRHKGALGEVQAARNTLERQVTDATSALDAAAAREADLTEQLGHERATRTTLEERVAGVEATLERVRQDYQAAAADVKRLKQRESDLASELADTHTSRETLERQLADAVTAIREAAAREELLNEEVEASAWDVDRLSLREDDLMSELADAQAARQAIEQTLADVRARFVEQRQQLEIQLAQERVQHESHTSEMNERSRALTIERDTLQQSLAALQDRARQLQESLKASVEALEVSRAESHRLFDHAGVAMFRCTREGVLTDVNRALTTLIGRRTYELASEDFAGAVFEAPQALSWLIERCLRTRTKESIETPWRRMDGSRLFMRLSARSLPSDIVEVVAEDLTRLRVLEERLGQAQRMEALGRLASEVAITCGGLLANIQQQGRDWLSSSTTDVDVQRGEELLADIGRAAGFLQELAACGDEQARTPMLVDLNTLVRDLEPVLKNVVGGDVEVALRETSTPLNVDVNAERIERLLVNLASYGRGRMTAGGRLRIEIGTSVVDRHFSAKHPNVRLGLHALITVTESRTATREEDAQPRKRKRKSARPGVDFATLQGLVSDCGGHLWIKVHPLGEMVAKIRLPLCSAQEQRAPRALSIRGGRERQTSRWFQS